MLSQRRPPPGHSLPSSDLVDVTASSSFPSCSGSPTRLIHSPHPPDCSSLSLPHTFAIYHSPGYGVYHSLTRPVVPGAASEIPAYCTEVPRTTSTSRNSLQLVSSEQEDALSNQSRKSVTLQHNRALGFRGEHRNARVREPSVIKTATLAA